METVILIEISWSLFFRCQFGNMPFPMLIQHKIHPKEHILKNVCTISKHLSFNKMCSNGSIYAIIFMYLIILISADAIKNSAHVISGSVSLSTQYHFTMETQVIKTCDHGICSNNILSIVFRLIIQNRAGSVGANRKISNVRCTLVGYKIVDHSDVVGTSPVGAAPTTSSFST